MRDNNVYGVRSPRPVSKVRDGALYEDQYCILTKANLIIKHCHYPTGDSVRVPLEHVASVQHEKGHTNFRSCKHWGMALNNIWWARDEAREFDRNRYVVVVAVEGSYHRKGFTVEDLRSFLNVFSQLLNDETKFVDRIC